MTGFSFFSQAVWWLLRISTFHQPKSAEDQLEAGSKPASLPRGGGRETCEGWGCIKGLGLGARARGRGHHLVCSAKGGGALPLYTQLAGTQLRCCYKISYQQPGGHSWSWTWGSRRVRVRVRVWVRAWFKMMDLEPAPLGVWVHQTGKRELPLRTTSPLQAQHGHQSPQPPKRVASTRSSQTAG